MADINDFDKDQLADFAKKEFNVDLDKRKLLASLRAEVAKLQAKPTAAAPGKRTEKTAPTHILNRDNGHWFPWTELLYAHLKNAVPCDENGKPV